ncbi:MAG TPA: hypothetical protein VGJ26_17070, partial [Pirellulales bacterium]
DRADKAAEEATANLKLANENKAALEKALGEVSSAKLAEVRATESAKKAVEQQEKANYRAALAEAKRLLNEQKYNEALAVLDSCPDALRDTAWISLREEARRQNFRIVPSPLGRVYIPPYQSPPFLVADADDSLQVRYLDTGSVAKRIDKSSASRGNHITFFFANARGNSCVAQVHGSHVLWCDLVALDHKIVPIPEVVDASQFRMGRLPRRFAITADLIPYRVFMIPGKTPTGVQVKDDAVGCCLLDKSTHAEWHIGLIEPLITATGAAGVKVLDGRTTGLSQSFLPHWGDPPLSPVAADLYGGVGLFTNDNGACWTVTNGASRVTGQGAPNFSRGILAVCIADRRVGVVRADIVQIHGTSSPIRLEREWPVASNAVQLIALSEDGSLVATYGRDKVVSVHDVATGSIVRKFADHDSVRNLEFDRGLEVLIGSPALGSKPKRNRLAWISDRGLCIWELASAPKIASAAPASDPFFSPPSGATTSIPTASNKTAPSQPQTNLGSGSSFSALDKN